MTHPTIEIRRLTRGDNRTTFDCGDVDLNRYFQRFAGQHQFRHHVGATYLAVAEQAILGYATVTVASVLSESLGPKARKFPRHPLPVLRLARLAVDVRARGRGVGGALLNYVFELGLEIRATAGCVGVVVDAKPGAVAYYERLGFTPFEAVEGELAERPMPQPMFRPLMPL